MTPKVKIRLSLLVMISLLSASFISVGSAYAAAPSVWIQNASDRAFQSSTLPANPTTSIVLYAAKNEYEAAQILVRSSTAQSNVYVSVSALSGPGGATIPTANIKVSKEYTHSNVWIATTTKGPTDNEIPPDGSSNYTDALVENTPITLPANETQPYFYSVYVPADQTPGTYTGTAVVNSGGGNVTVNVTVVVYNVTIPPTNQSTFQMNNWFTSAGWDYEQTEAGIIKQYNVALYDANWWKVIGNIASNMAKHRNNVIFTDPTALLIPDTTIDANGNYTFGWATFDKFVQKFVDAGAMQYIYSLPITRRIGEHDLKLQMLKNVNGVTARQLVDTDTPEANAYLATFFTALKAHLDAKGWTNSFIMSAEDEPHSQAEVEVADRIYAKYKMYFPNALISEAHDGITLGLEDKLTTFVPRTDNYEDHILYYQQQRLSGKNLWLYTCIDPRLDYMNRFISFHLDKTRLIPWLVWKVGGNGYLHWGWNYWALPDAGGTWNAVDTFDSSQSGDSWLVRPNKAAYDIYDSVRSEAQLDGIEDYELLNILKQSKPLVAKSIAETLITNSTLYTRQGSLVVNRHKELLDEIVSANSDVRFPFTDNFDSGDEGNWKHSVGTWSMSGGEYSQTSLTGYNNVSAIKGRSYGDFALTFDVKIANDNGNHQNWAGAMIRSMNATDLDTGYLIGVRNNGEIHLWRTGTVLAAAQIPGYVAGQYTTVKVVTQGSNIKVFAGNNPAALLEVNDTGYTSGNIGLITGGASAKFDNVVVNAEQNYAEGKPVAYWSNYTGDGWAPQNAVDGKTSSSTQSLGYTSDSNITVQNHNEWISVDFGKSYPLSRVDLYPRNDGANTGFGFPIDFTIQTSTDNQNWTTVVTKTGYAKPGNEVQSFPFASVNARYIKVNATKLRTEAADANTYRLHFAEIQAFGGNLAAGKKVTASSSYESLADGWAKANATDGARLSNAFYSMGWVSGNNLTTNHTEWVKVDLGGSSTISNVNLYPDNADKELGFFFPIDFTIQTSTDDVNWTTVVSRTGYAMPGYAAQSFSFPSTTARYVKINGTNLRFNQGVYRMGFAEIEVK
ncbi:glycoside hydrolase domain-containing protein [Cohnella soli]|uniref:Glycoside hydrolase domain-containing protein n=1 Tax=Cohnella soli TaxID=425005 RepID=A0ABW0HY18_9BACL